MASTTFSLDLARECLLEDGFFNLQDSAVGERILDMERRDFPFATAYGLDFCKYVLFHPRIRCVLEASFQKCTLGHSMRYNKKPGQVFRFLPGGPNTSFALMVHQCAKGSQVKYYKGSCKYAPTPNSRKLENNEPLEPLLEDSGPVLVEAGCQPAEFSFKDGGLIIADARLAFEFTEGYTIVDVFFPDNLLPSKKMILPSYSTEVADKIDEMQCGTIRVNFRFRNDHKDVA